MMATALRLYETVDQLEIVRSWIDEHEEQIIAAGGDLDALPELAALLDQAEGQFTVKVENVALYIRELLLSAGAVKDEAARLAVRARVMERAAESMKEYLRRQLERANVPKVEGHFCTVRVQKNPPAVRCTLDQETLRSRFIAGEEWVIEVPATYRVDSKLLVARHKNDAALPEGIAVEQGTHVRIA